jgi:hypothetical protein
MVATMASRRFNHSGAFAAHRGLDLALHSGLVTFVSGQVIPPPSEPFGARLLIWLADRAEPAANRQQAARTLRRL